MKLSDKGQIIPPPRLKGGLQKVSIEIQSWPEIISASHWSIEDQTKVDGVDFYIGKRELGHIHLDGEIHLRFTRSLRDKLISAELAKSFRWNDAWVRFHISNKKSAEHALWLFKLAYERINKVGSKEILRRIKEGSGYN